MINNDVLRRLRYSLNINDEKVLEICNLSGYVLEKPKLTGLFKKEDEPGFEECTDKVLESFLDGLIIYKRGKKETNQDTNKIRPAFLTNNAILKKLRIAFELKEEDMLSVFKLGHMAISKTELTALFRRKGHKHYKKCGDQFLRSFLTGLTVRLRA